jgi:hypothetical protein
MKILDRPDSRTDKLKMNWRLLFYLILAISLWLLTTVIFWKGYVGNDDMFYARYAFLFHREPINWWECRLPAILAMRTAFFVLGPTEIAAALPALLASLLGIGAIAWYVGWPRDLNSQTNSTILLAITVPMDVVFRTIPLASSIASGLLVCGSVLILKAKPFGSAVGCALFASAFLTHEVSCFYIAIFCTTMVLTDRGRYLRSFLLSAMFSAAAVAAQCAYYSARFGDPFLRSKLAIGESAGHPALVDPDTHISGMTFLLWPIQNLAFSKVFGCSLLLTFGCGVMAWRRLNKEERILLVSGFLTWFYLGYGSKVPWVYQPLARQYHFYGPLTLAISMLLPVCLGYLFERFARPKLYALATIGGVVALNLALCAIGGRWGQDVKVSESLLKYASSHPGETFLTDVPTMNQMYVLNGFKLPSNVVCRNGPSVDNDLLVNKEPLNNSVPRFKFPEGRLDRILLNLDHTTDGFGGDQQFTDYLAAHQKERERIVPVRYRLLLLPVRRFVAGRSFAIRSEGGVVVSLH